MIDAIWRPPDHDHGDLGGVWSATNAGVTVVD